MDLCGFKVYATSGTPSDTIYLAALEITGNVDLVLSGINIGDNTSLQVILSSGTLGAAFQAALLGIPAIAYSVDVESSDELEDNEELEPLLKAVIRESAMYVLRHGMPRGVDVISINFPRVVSRGARVKLVRARSLSSRRRSMLGLTHVEVSIIGYLVHCLNLNQTLIRTWFIGRAILRLRH